MSRRYADPVVKYLVTEDKKLNEELRNAITQSLNPSELDTLSLFLQSYDFKVEKKLVGKTLLRKLHRIKSRGTDFATAFDSFQRRLDNLEISRRREGSIEDVLMNEKFYTNYHSSDVKYEGFPIDLSDPESAKSYGLEDGPIR